MGKFIIDNRAMVQPNLPDNAALLASERVWMEGAALEQLARVAAFEGCVRAVGMPDLHPGPTVPIGVAIAFDERIYPQLVGSDAGCGVRVVSFAKLKLKGDRLEQRIREATDVAPLPDLDRAAAMRAVWRSGPRGLIGVPGVPDSLAELVAMIDPERDDHLPRSGELPEAFAELADHYGEALGSVGGGNHFVELAQIERVFGEGARRQDDLRWGLERGEFAIVAHSGSRGLGTALAQRWGHACLSTPEQGATYLAELAGACRYARANRVILSWRLLDAVGAAKPGRVRGSFDLIHNDVAREQVEQRELWVHRKGCAPAHAEQPTVVLGTRGTASYVMRGLGNQACLCSVAHGAGRRMTRSEARAKVAHKYARKSLTRTACGSRVICDDKDLLYEEHPDAYKNIDDVVESLEQAGAATRVAMLVPMITVKR
jgi:release factor H-coupled RctB family protein